MTDWIADAESGSSVRAKLNAIPFKGTSKQITTGASPTVISVASNDLAGTDVYVITTGGTGGDEYIELNALPYSQPVSEPYCAPEHNGRRVQFVIAVQTDPNDVVRIVLIGSETRIFVANNFGTFHGEFYVSDGEELPVGEPDLAAKLDFAGSSVGFVWGDIGWYYQNLASNDDTVFANQALQSDGDVITLRGRDFHTATRNGGDVRIQSGQGNGASQRGGNVQVTLGQGANDAAPGNFLIINLPTIDPGIADPTLVGEAIWLNAGVLTISTGV